MPGKINLSALPVGSNVLDRDKDEWTKVDNGRWKYILSQGGADTSAELGSSARSSAEMEEFAPFTMAPADPYQEARLALRDVLGMEPDQQMIRNTMDTARQPRTSVEQAATLTVGAAKLADAELEPAHEVARSILIVTALGDDTGSRLVVSADTTAGLARLRAHSALDALLDQHGISR